jgi:hypothetical protein
MGSRRYAAQYRRGKGFFVGDRTEDKYGYDERFTQFFPEREKAEAEARRLNAEKCPSIAAWGLHQFLLCHPGEWIKISDIGGMGCPSLRTMRQAADELATRGQAEVRGQWKSHEAMSSEGRLVHWTDRWYEVRLHNMPFSGSQGDSDG